MIEELLNELEEFINKYEESGLTLIAYLDIINMPSENYEAMLANIKKHIRLETKKQYDELINRIKIQENKIHRKVAKAIVANRMENPNYTAVDYYMEYGFLRCSAKKLKTSLLKPIDEKDKEKFSRDQIQAFDKVFPCISYSFAYELCKYSREYFLKNVTRRDKNNVLYPLSEHEEALAEMDKYYMPYSQLFFDIVLKRIHDKKHNLSR